MSLPGVALQIQGARVDDPLPLSHGQLVLILPAYIQFVYAIRCVSVYVTQLSASSSRSQNPGETNPAPGQWTFVSARLPCSLQVVQSTRCLRGSRNILFSACGC